MELLEVPPDDIKIPEVRVTARFDDETWEQFQSSIKQTGVIAPILCCRVDKELVLVDGLHRLVESKKNGDKLINVAVFPGDMADVLTKNLFIDKISGKPPVSEMVNVIEVLWKELNLDSEAIASKTGMTRDYVEKLQKLSTLTPMCREALDQGRIGVGHAAALAKLEDPVRQEAVLGQQFLYRWSIKDLEEHIKNIMEIVEDQEQPKPEEAPRPPFRPKCTFCGQEYEIHDVANPTICKYCSGELFAMQAAARAQFEAEQAAKKETPPTPS